MPVGNQEHRGVPVTVSVALCGIDQLFNLSLGQVLSAAKLAVRPAPQGNCSFLVVGFTSRRFGFAGILASYRSQLEASKAEQAKQLALFELKDDCRPEAERTAAGRYLEPTFFLLTVRSEKSS